MCFVCDKDDIETLTESKNDSNTRFVMLEDCGHVFDGVWMDNWMNSSTNAGKSEIGMKTCPKCHVPIINTKRYWNATQKNYESILDAFSNFHQYSLKFNKKDLVGSLLVLQHKFRDEVCKIGAALNLDQNFQETRQIRNLNVEEYILYEYQLDFLRKVIRLKTIHQYNESSLKKLIATLMKCSKLSPQASFEFSCELRRLDISIVLQRTQKRVNASKNVSDVFKLDKISCLSKEIEQLVSPLEFDESAEDKIKVMLKEIENEIGMYEYIYPYERKQILKTANLNEGNWYRCQKGHACFSDDNKNLSNCLNCQAVGPSRGQNKNKNKKYQNPKTFHHQGNWGICSQGHYFIIFNEKSKCLYCVGLTPEQNGNQNQKQNFQNKNNRKKYPKRK
ncbi:NFX1-type zinc finger-containing protein 1 [Armadillidium vulgare]|nr:NFX1-type zinc finger-containing protein 1 [Armadillidium vulgare]